MKAALIYIFVLLCPLALGQLAGTASESQPALTVQECTSDSCKSVPSSVTIDANWRWLHTSTGSNCYTGNQWDTSICSDPTTCASECVLEAASAAEYQGTYGITSSGDELSLGFVTHGPYSTNVGSRVYLMENPDTYKVFKLLNKEFTFDVDVSKLDCGLNGALYFVEMSADGGKSAHSGNKAGAKYGTGYCDAQCPHDVKFINGEANVLDWVPSRSDPNSGTGHYGTCCAEMDIWEANKRSNAYTPHPCDVEGQTRCDGTDCGDNASGNRYNGVCDKDGCDFNPFRMGNETFFGPDMFVNSNAPVTVVTQFITDDNTDNGDLVEIRRIYKQNNQVIHNAVTSFKSLSGANSITDSFCSAQKTLFGDRDDFTVKGGLKAMGESLRRGMVLTMSLWVDYDANCLWLDSTYPTDADPSKPGVARGTCATTSGNPVDVIASAPSSSVKFSNIRYGSIGSTAGTGSALPPAPPTQQPPTQRPPTQQPPTQQPPTQQPPTQQPPTQRPPTQQPPTQRPPTQRPPTQQPPTQQPPTQRPPTQRPPTQQPPTQRPPTQQPPTSPGACGESVTFTQTPSGQWTDGGNDYSLWQVSFTSTQNINSLSLKPSVVFHSFWQLVDKKDGTYTPDDWRLNSNQPIPAGSTVNFGYIAVGKEKATFTVTSASCGNNNKRRMVEVGTKFAGSAP